VVGGSLRVRPVATGMLLLVLPLALGACSTTVEDHTEDVAALVSWTPTKEVKASAFEPVSQMERGGFSIADPAPYRVGVRDVLDVRVLSKGTAPGFETAVVAPVKENGLVYLPGSRRIAAADKTTLEIEEAITESLKRDVTDPLVTVEVTLFRARNARVLGDGVEAEQVLPVDGRLTLLEALIKAGATRKPTADREEAYLLRRGKILPFSIAAIVEQADPAGDAVLEQGDHVVVPALTDRMDFVYVFGQVKIPGRFEMDHKERTWATGKLTLMGAIGLAGGVIEGQVDCNKICLFRGGCRDLRVFRIGLQELYQCGESIALEPGDRVYVAPNEMAKFNLGLQQFLPSIGTLGTTVGLILSGAALYETSR
jgi:polysaccharide biosynthesis/export protein